MVSQDVDKDRAQVNLSSNDTANLLTLGYTKQEHLDLQRLYSKTTQDNSNPYRRFQWKDKFMVNFNTSTSDSKTRWRVTLPIVNQIRNFCGNEHLEALADLTTGIDAIEKKKQGFVKHKDHMKGNKAPIMMRTLQ